MGLGGARKGWTSGHRGRVQGTGDAGCSRGRGNPTSRKVPHDGRGPSCYGGTSMHLAVCHSAHVSPPLPRGSLPPAVRFLGFSLQVTQRKQSSRWEGRKEAASRSGRWPLGGAGALKGHTLLSCHLREAGGLGGTRKAGPRRSIPPQVRTQGSGQGAAPRCTGWGAARVLPTTFLCWHPFLQKGVTKEADHLQAAALAKAVVSLGWPPPGFAWTHATETWHGTRDSATLWSCGFVIIVGHSARIQTLPKN